MNANQNHAPRPPRMEEAPGTRPTGAEAARPATPAAVLALLRPSRETPRALRINGLWKTGPLAEPQGATS